MYSIAHRVHRMVTDTFWRTFHPNEKISTGWWGWGCMPTPFHHMYRHVQHFVLYAPAERADTLPFFYSTPICTLWYYLFTEQHWSEVGEPFHFVIEGVNRDLLKNLKISLTYFNLNRGKNRKYNYSLPENHFISLQTSRGSYLDLQIIIFVKKFEFYRVTQSLEDRFLFLVNSFLF
jgi:hypothetical protein